MGCSSCTPPSHTTIVFPVGNILARFFAEKYLCTGKMISLSVHVVYVFALEANLSMFQPADYLKNITIVVTPMEPSMLFSFLSVNVKP